MSQHILKLSHDGTNAYLVKTGASFFLIDTGFPYQRSKLEAELKSAGCQPGDLKLVVLTHGDLDHTGNAAFFREKFGAKIAMHRGDTKMCKKDGLTRDRGEIPSDVPMLLLIAWLLRGFVRYLFKQRFSGIPFEPFEPDLLLDEGNNLDKHGFDARVLYTPGHSQGSISLQTGEGDLFCGDLFNHVKNRIIKSTDQAGLQRLRALGIKTIYPGHGEPFPSEKLFTHRQGRSNGD